MSDILKESPQLSSEKLTSYTLNPWTPGLKSSNPVLLQSASCLHWQFYLLDFPNYSKVGFCVPHISIYSSDIELHQIALPFILQLAYSV